MRPRWWGDPEPSLPQGFPGSWTRAGAAHRAVTGAHETVTARSGVERRERQLEPSSGGGDVPAAAVEQLRLGLRLTDVDPEALEPATDGVALRPLAQLPVDAAVGVRRRDQHL